MSIQNILIQDIEDAALGFLAKNDYSHIKGIVIGLQDTSMTGAEKRAKAIDIAREYGITIADCLLKAAIELAVGWLQANPSTAAIGVAAQVAVTAVEANPSITPHPGFLSGLFKGLAGIQNAQS